MKKPNRADFERVQNAADAECVQLSIQTDINTIVRAYVERKLKEFPDEQKPKNSSVA